MAKKIGLRLDVRGTAENSCKRVMSNIFILSFALTYRNELTLKDYANLPIRRALKSKWQGCMEVDDFHKGADTTYSFS